MARPSKSTRNQQHSQSLITVTVGPGSETGLYYILIANVREVSFPPYTSVRLIGVCSFRTVRQGKN